MSVSTVLALSVAAVAVFWGCVFLGMGLTSHPAPPAVVVSSASVASAPDGPPTSVPPLPPTLPPSRAQPAAPPPTRHTTRPAPTTAGIQHGVHPGAFCTPHYAFGYTSAGTLMQCKPSATDPRFRWRAAL